MVGAMVLLVVLVLVYVGVQSLRTRPAAEVRTVDYARVVPDARKTADFDLLAPPRLPAGWRATTVSFSGEPDAHWHLGVLTSRNRYVGLEQGRGSVGAMVTTYVDKAATRGRPVVVAGRSWTTYTDAGGDLALAHRVGHTTTVVVGHDVPRAGLLAYAASLR
jgi:hypothetical protein